MCPALINEPTLLYLYSTRGKYVDGEKFQFATSLVFVQCVTNALFAQGGKEF